MAATSLSSSSATIFFSSPLLFTALPSLSGLTSQKIRHHRRGGRGTLKLTARCSESEDGGGGRMVDENMIVLRNRIHETEVIERKPPSEWMDWEKRFYVGSYDSLICEAGWNTPGAIDGHAPQVLLSDWLLLSRLACLLPHFSSSLWFKNMTLYVIVVLES